MPKGELLRFLVYIITVIGERSRGKGVADIYGEVGDISKGAEARAMAAYVGFSCFSVVETGDNIDKRGDGGVEAGGIDRNPAFPDFINGKKKEKSISIIIIGG